MRHLLEIDDLTGDELRQILDLARLEPNDTPRVLKEAGVACYFAKPSTRTRNSTEMAVVQLGGHPVYITDAEVGIGHRESAEDVTRTLACYHRVLCARVFGHDVLERIAALNVIPVVNLLSDAAHPLQAIADVLTIEAEFGSVEGRNVAYVGDCNNVARSLTLAVSALGGRMTLAAPPDHRFSDIDRDRLANAGAEFTYLDRADQVSGVDVVYTDTWVSMGQEGDREQRLRSFEGFQVDEPMLARNPDAIFLHCLPAHRGEEVTGGVLDGEQSRIWPQAANRLRSIRGVLQWLMDQQVDPADPSAIDPPAARG